MMQNRTKNKMFYFDIVSARKYEILILYTEK